MGRGVNLLLGRVGLRALGWTGRTRALRQQYNSPRSRLALDRQSRSRWQTEGLEKPSCRRERHGIEACQRAALRCSMASCRLRAAWSRVVWQMQAEVRVGEVQQQSRLGQPHQIVPQERHLLSGWVQGGMSCGGCALRLIWTQVGMWAGMS